MTKNNNNIIKNVILSIFEEEGPTPIIFWPEDIDEGARLLIATKTISLLMGDVIYQNGDTIEGINYFGILPFPDMGLKALTYFFLVPDEDARGHAKASTITVLIEEHNSSFFYENMKYLRVKLDKAASEIQFSKEIQEYQRVIDDLKEELFEFCNDLNDPFSNKRKLKIVLAGLDRAGKTSFLLGVKKRYSEIIKTLPTKGVERSEENIFEEQNSQISIWDLGGQKKYRDKYLEQSEFYLYNIDLLFYLIDIQDSERLSDSLELLFRITNSMKELDEFPPLVICLNKFDPDIKDALNVKRNFQMVTSQIKKKVKKFFIKFFKTSIFDYWSLISAYSYGLSQLSPNREFFRNRLKIFAKNTNSDALLLLNENGIILSSYSNDINFEKVFEISAPHFQTLYKTFNEFKLLKKDYIISSGMKKDTKNIVFKKVKVDKYNLYLLLFMEEYNSIEKIEKYLPTFSNILNELISTYI